jgi:hypothetical protein
MGVVYLARDAALDREVAVKVLQPRLASDPEFEKRFVREARTAAKLDHPNIVQVYSAGREGDVLYIAMQLVKGRALDAHLKARGALPAREALLIVRQAALALQAAHEAGLIHRDIKPNNIMIDDAGRVKLMDFGLTRSRRESEAITEPGVFFGTPEYASPEQCETAEVDARADLYSLGAVCYEMLTGRRPHAGETPLALFRKILEEPPVPVRALAPGVPPALAVLVERLMAKRPEDRVASAAELVRELDVLLAGGKTAGGARRTWQAVGAALAVGAVLALGFFLRAPSAPAPVPAPPRAGKLKLVVFDLKNGIPNAESGWYSIALSDMLIAALSKQPALDVPTRDVLLFKLEEREVGGKVTEDNRKVLTDVLRAGAYLSGTYYAQGGRLRLTLAAYRLPGSEQMFPALSFDGVESDLLGLVDRAELGLRRALAGDAAEPLALGRREVEDRSLGRPAAEPPAPAEDLKKTAIVRQQAPAGAAAAAPRAERRPHAPLNRESEKSAWTPAPEELTRAWYENRKALEAVKLRQEDFEPLLALLRQEFARDGRAGEADKAQPAEGKARQALRLEFACPSCGSVAVGFGRCDDCKRTRVVRPKPTAR